VGTTNSAVRIGVVSAGGGPTTWVRLDGDPRDHYLPRIEWAGPDELLLQRMNRLQNTNEVMLAAVASGAARTVFTDRDDAWLDVFDPFTWLDGGKAFLWVSERDGWRHAYRVALDGGPITLVTAGDYDLMSIAAVDEAGGWLYFIASPDNATQRYLYRTRLNGKSKAERVTPANAPGTHRYDVSPNAKWALHSHSRLELPWAVDLVSVPDHRRVRPLAENAEQRAAGAATLARPADYFTVDSGAGPSPTAG
jgi:dipeptidyl-peptidase-4